MTPQQKIAKVVGDLVRLGKTKEATELLEKYSQEYTDREEKEAAVNYKLLARVRLMEAFKKGGVPGALRALELRIQRMTNKEKLQGVVDAIDDILADSEDLQTNWGIPNAEEEFLRLQKLAKKQIRRPQLPRARKRPKANTFAMVPIPIRKALDLCARKIKKDLQGENPEQIFIPNAKGKNTRLTDQIAGYLVAKILEDV